MIVGKGQRIRISFAACRRETRLLGRYINVFAEHIGLSEKICFEIELAVVEAANNLIIHGCEDNPEQRLEFELLHQPGKLSIILRDHKAGIDCLPNTPMPIEKNPTVENLCAGGFGLALIHKLMDEVHYRSENGVSTMTMIKWLPEQGRDDTNHAKT